eukprot:63623_1
MEQLMYELDPIENAFIGNVRVGLSSSIGHGTVVRGDVAPVRIGSHTKVHENCVVHVTGSPCTPTTVGNYVEVCQGSILHGCILHDNVSVRQSCIIMDGAVVGKSSIVLAGSLVPVGKVIPSNQIWSGRPVRYLKDR